MTRDEAFRLMTEHVQAPGLRRHMVAVEAAMRDYAARLGGDPEIWGLAGLLHDYDWEIHPTLEAHPVEGAPLLRERGCPEEVVHAILAHNSVSTGVERERPIDYALLACDEVTGQVIAGALVRPSKDIRDAEVSSVKKKWKEKAFAAGVDRPGVERAVAEFSENCFAGRLDLWQHTGNVLAAMQGLAEALELDGRLAAKQ